MADVILVQPKVELLDEIQSSPTPPLSLLGICSEIKEEYDIKLIDTRIETKWKKLLLKELDKNPLCVATTSMTGKQIKYALEISKFVKENSNVSIVWGGPHVTSLPSQSLKSDYIDFVVKGEGRTTFKKLVDSFKKKKKRIKKIHEIKFNNHDFNIPYELIDIKKYFVNRFGRKSIMMVTTMGCPCSCSFCYNNDKKWSSMPEKEVFDLIDYFYYKYKIKHFWFMENNSFVNLKRIKNIANFFLDKKDVSWEAASDIKSLGEVDTELLRLLEKSNCKLLTPGIESGSQRILNLLGKNISIKKILEINRKVSKFNIIQYYSFMCGFPTETEYDIDMTIKLIFQLLKDNSYAETSSITPLIPLPNTKTFNFILRKGYLMPSTLEQWSLMNPYEIYDTIFSDWVPNDLKKKLMNIHMTSSFLDNKNNYIKSHFLRLTSSFYSKLAKYRLKKNNFSFLFEKRIYDTFIKSYLN